MTCVAQEKFAAAGTPKPRVLDGMHWKKGMDGRFHMAMTNMFHICFYIAKKEKPFTDFPDLVDLNERTGSNVPHFYKSDTACAR